jgi:anti-sigma regulatory factor (Ser/Thr protein kinase)
VRAALEDIGGVPEPDITIYNVQLAANEIFANIAGHAYAGRSDGRVAVVLMFDATTRRFAIEFHDTGAPFDEASVQTPDLENLHEGGYGLFLAQSLMDMVTYTAGTDSNCWLLAKQL